MEKDVRNRKPGKKYPAAYTVQISPEWGQKEQDRHVVERRSKKESRKDGR